MSNNPEEKVLKYLNQQIRKLRLSDFEELAPQYFNVTFSYLSSELLKLKKPVSKVNLTNLLMDGIKEVGWDVKKMLTVAATLELENMVRMKPGQGPQWQAQQLSFSNSVLANNDDDKPFGEVLRRSIKSRQEDAKILAKTSNGLMWIAVLYKHPDGENFFEMPIHLVISNDCQYLFTKKALPLRLNEAVKIATKCQKIKRLHLTGRDLPSLLLLLQGREGAANPRPAFVPQTPKLNSSGCDFTRGTEVKHYTKQCLGENIRLEQYSVESANKRWQGDDVPELRLVEFKSKVVFSGDVSALLAALPAAGICNPPFPDYIRDFAILGRSHVSSGL